LQAGAQSNISGFSGGVFDYCNGVKTIASTTSTTFPPTTVSSPTRRNTTGSPVVTAVACNTLTIASGSFSGINTIHYWIYRNGALAGWPRHRSVVSGLRQHVNNRAELRAHHPAKQRPTRLVSPLHRYRRGHHQLDAGQRRGQHGFQRRGSARTIP